MCKRALCFLLSAIFLLGLVGCALPDPVDISAEIMVDTTDGEVAITGYPGSEEHVSLPDEINGQPVTLITPAFVAGKTYKSVKLPAAIDTYARRGDEFVLCADGDEKKIPINEHTAPGIYCRFFNTESIHINGVSYKSKINKDLTFSDLKNIRWKYVGPHKGESVVAYFVFENEDFFKVSFEGKSTSVMIDYEMKGQTVEFKIYEGTSFGSEPPSTTYIMEKIGNSLVLWDENVILYPTDDKEPEPESDDVWEYQDIGNNEVMITGYNGNAAIVHFPTSLHGKTVRRISSSIADDYAFANVTGLGPFNFLSYEATTGLYTLDCNGEGFMMRGTLERFYSLCKFFNTDELIVSDRHCTYDAALKQEIILDCTWSAAGDEDHPNNLRIEFLADGGFTFEELGDEGAVRTVTGRHTISGDNITVITDSGETLVFEYMGDSVICWGGSSIFDGTTAADDNAYFELDTVTDQQIGWNATWEAPQGENGPIHGHVLQFDMVKGKVTVTPGSVGECIPAGTYSYKIRGRYTTLTSDKGETYILTAKYMTLVDPFGNEYC